MRFSCLQENLNKGLSTVSRLVSSKTQLPVLGNILIATDNDRLKLTATNLETGINFWLGAKIEKEGALTIPARALTELVASLPPGKIDLETEGDLLKIASSSYKASLNGLSAKEFPALPPSPQKPDFSFPPEFFVEMVSQVAFAAAQDEGRPVLTGVRLSQEGEQLVLAATDGYRLSLKKNPFKKEVIEGSLIIPARTLLEVAHVVQERKKEKEVKEVDFTLLPGEGQTSFSFEDVEVTTRLIEGEFPDFSKIIPQSFTTQVILEKEALLEATKVASIFARDAANIVKWKISSSGSEEGRVVISANSPQVGENSSEVEAKIDGEGGEIAFNFRFLLDFLNTVKSKEITFQMSGPLNPGVFKPVGDQSFSHLIMPVRVQG